MEVDELMNNFGNDCPADRILAAVPSLLDRLKKEFSKYCNDGESTQAKLNAAGVVLKTLKTLRNLCARGMDVQNEIVALPDFFQTVKNLLMGEVCCAQDSDRIRLMCWQMIANLCVQNTMTQEMVWLEMKDLIITNLCGGDREANISAMILHNMLLFNSLITNSDKLIIMQYLIRIKETSSHQAQSKAPLEFVKLCLEKLIMDDEIVVFYEELSESDRILLLYFICECVHTSTNKKALPHDLLDHLCLELKLKSDCILNAKSSYISSINPVEVKAILHIISSASAVELYFPQLSNDGSLFLNVGCLLIAVHAFGKYTDQNQFTPVQKLEQVAPGSKANSEIERDISFELKTLLVRIISNLTYKTQKNQDLARDIDLIPTILECTTIDARNPLVKEWSILAIHNLCKHNEENQKIIAQLAKVGDAPNAILKEFNIDTGSVRIKQF